MIVSRLELVDFRNYAAASFEFEPGVTAVVGLNGQGKTNLAEALAYLATLSSFRGAPGDALIRVGADSAIVRATVLHEPMVGGGAAHETPREMPASAREMAASAREIPASAREMLVELELSRHGRNRVQVNRQRLTRARELLGVMRVSVFSPDDLALVKEGPQDRRRFMDDTLVSLAVKYDALRLELDRVVKQRNVLLKQAGGRLDGDALFTLDVWDAKMSEIGDQFGHARAVLIAKLSPLVSEAYERLADRATPVELRYEPAWRQRGLSVALADARRDDIRRGVSTVGPQRDDVDMFVNGLPARTHASQGEQRTLALSLRLAAHRLVAERVDSTPLLVLDDVLSELDPRRCSALLEHLPAGQVILTTAGTLPDAAHPDAILRIDAGACVPAGDRPVHAPAGQDS